VVVVLGYGGFAVATAVAALGFRSRAVKVIERERNGEQE
jgi:shikimate 5-dehydrogenase